MFKGLAVLSERRQRARWGFFLKKKKSEKEIKKGKRESTKGRRQKGAFVCEEKERSGCLLWRNLRPSLWDFLGFQLSFFSFAYFFFFFVYASFTCPFSSKLGNLVHFQFVCPCFKHGLGCISLNKRNVLVDVYLFFSISNMFCLMLTFFCVPF